MTVIVAASAVTVAQEPRQLFQQALAKERAEGALDEAIALYQRVVREAGSDRVLASRALLQLGGVYEKLGRAEAKTVYGRLVSEFSEQTETTGTARTRLAALTGGPQRPAGGQVAAQRPTISEAPIYGTGLLSPDGQWMAIGGRANRAISYLNGYRSLYVRHVRTGETRDLALPDEPGFLGVGFYVWSPDSLRLAYNVCTQPPLGCELVAVRIDRPGTEVILPRREGYFTPLGWSPDGGTIAVRFNGGGGTPGPMVGLVNVADGTVRDLYKAQPGEGPQFQRPGDIAYSPDGRFLAGSTGLRADGPWGNVFVLPMDGSGPRLLIDHPAEDKFAAWTPAGDVLFLSDRTGTFDLWMVRVRDGRTVGLPFVVRRNVGTAQFHGLSPQGELYYQSPGPRRGVAGGVDFSDTANDLYVATLDASTGDLVGAPVSIAPEQPGRSHSPSWSADGRSLLYRTRTSDSLVWSGLAILSLRSGEARRIPLSDLSNLRSAWLSHDGSSAIVIAQAPAQDGLPPRQRQFRLYHVDARTGAGTPLPGEPVASNTVEISADGRMAVLLRPAAANQGVTAALIVRDLITGHDRAILEAEPKVQVNGFALSPDRAQVAFRLIEGSRARMMVVPVAGGTPRDVTALPTTFAGTQRTTWSADGRFIYFAEQTTRDAETEELWRVPSAGGQAVKVLSFHASMLNPRIDPTGRHLAFTAEVSGWNERLGMVRPSPLTPPWEVAHEWGKELVLEHFLPAALLRPANGGR
jgi:Tol biopolymer transport system component